MYELLQSADCLVALLKRALVFRKKLQNMEYRCLDNNIEI